MDLQKTPMKIVEEEEEEVAEIQPDPLHQLILHFSHNALTERRWADAQTLPHETLQLSDSSFARLSSSHLDEDPLYIAYADMMAKVVAFCPLLLHESLSSQSSGVCAGRAVQRTTTRRKKRRKGKRKHLRFAHVVSTPS